MYSSNVHTAIVCETVAEYEAWYRSIMLWWTEPRSQDRAITPLGAVKGLLEVTHNV